MNIIHYEVYVLEGRGWILHARYPRSDREEAIKEAKELEQTLNIRVKVVRETYYSDNNTFDEAEVYISGMKRTDSAPAAPRGAQSRASGGSSSGGGSGGRSAAGSRSSSSASSAQTSAAPARKARSGDSAAAHKVLFRLILIVLTALALSLGALKATPSLVLYLFDYGFRISPESYGQLLFGVFVVVFLSTAIPMALRFIPREAHIAIKKRQPAAPVSDRDRQLKKSLDKLAAKANADDDRIKGTQDDHDDEPLPELPELPDPLEEEKKRMEEEAKRRMEEEKAAEAEKAKNDGAESQEVLNTVVMRFLGTAVNAMKKVVDSLDQYNKFALNLYLAGGVQELCSRNKLNEAAERNLLKVGLETLGTSGDMAQRFYDKIGEYLLEPRYMLLVQSGRAAMQEWLAGREATAHEPLTTAVKEWSKPKETAKQSICTVMFTDMVGSTDLTQAKGDAAAQEIVRRHNSIVRTALAQFGGKEIKHTGDGIMASFPSAANAVEATIVIQRQVADHNKRAPDQELHLRIGLNAGEPIQEEDDLFGSTVQLAARVCAATDTDQILCTPVVKDLSSGKGDAQFASAGEHALKGFKDRMTLFEVRWR